MQRLPSILRKPTVALFWAWIALNIVLWLISVFDGSLHDDMLRAVDSAVAEGSKLAQSRDAAAESFIYISFAYFVVTSLVGAVLVHYSAARSRWAFLVLIPAALWWAYESASAPITLGRMYPGAIHAWDWIVAGLGAAVWIFILGYTSKSRLAAMNANAREARGNALIEEARLRLAEISFPSTLHACLYFLRKDPNDGFAWYERRPFLIFLMIKWAAELWNPTEERRDGDDEDFNFVEQRIWDAIGLLVRDRGPTIMLRRAAFQQFWYQRSFQIGAIPRQAMLFGRLMRDSNVMHAFVADARIEPEHFVRQLARMASQMGQFLGIPALDQLQPEPSDRDAQDWPRTTQFFITTPRQLQERMLALARYNTPRAVELCEQTPLIRTPFITTHNGEECVHHQVLFQGISTVMYDILRDRGAEAFMREFGPAFEEYVNAVLQELPYQVIRENELQEMLGDEGKCVDFAVVSDNALLLVDAKGIEGHYDERYHNLSEVLTEKLRTTAIHAVQQAIETATRLPDELKRPLTVFVCVTYKQLNIGDGDALRDLTHGTEEWNNARWLEPRLPPSNMFTVSVNEFELLCGVLRRGASIADVFTRVLQDNKNPQTSKFLFEQHMARYGQVDIPTCSRLAAFELCGIA